jgi:hypothetical protein
VFAIHRKQETIACVAFGLNQAFAADPFQLLAETVNIDVKFMDLVFQVASPNATDQMVARNQFPGMPNE